ncbi:peptidase M23 [Phaeobacter gallaeciensis]|uniref:Peptidase M23 n=2 Tax=Roseobacteraceae TaxID=2854170 RepID=A0A366WZE5_9RHOB|nr:MULTISPECIES: peptidase M23 [Roseobacteraceae]MBT3143788.1 peptidase M23 [Falsiruegeria litorea]MBT8169547.1 peptidase M23 [Falsiruegeria litorea]RBW53542.1 peptidase M23 [Phaeobacter gallaeciensis]
MKTIVSALLVLATGPALAHSGFHMHPHASDPSWLPLLVTFLVVAFGGALVAVRRK